MRVSQEVFGILPEDELQYHPSNLSLRGKLGINHVESTTNRMLHSNFYSKSPKHQDECLYPIKEEMVHTLEYPKGDGLLTVKQHTLE